MALKTVLEQLESIQATIALAEEGIKIGSGDMTLERERLQVLYNREADLLARYRAEQNNGGMTINVGIPRRTY